MGPQGEFSTEAPLRRLVRYQGHFQTSQAEDQQTAARTQATPRYETQGFRLRRRFGGGSTECRSCGCSGRDPNDTVRDAGGRLTTATRDVTITPSARHASADIDTAATLAHY